MSDANGLDGVAVARRALDAFAAETFGSITFEQLVDDDRRCAIVDLIADLLHVAKCQGLDPDEVLAIALKKHVTKLGEHG